MLNRLSCDFLAPTLILKAPLKGQNLKITNSTIKYTENGIPEVGELVFQVNLAVIH